MEIALKDLLCSKQHKQAHALCLQLEQDSEEHDSLYQSIPLFLEMLGSSDTYIRVRGFRLLCAQAKWDADGQIEQNLEKILEALEDSKPTNLRQYLSVLPKIMQCKPHLTAQIHTKLNSLDLTKYNDSVRPLIMKDIAEIISSKGA